MKLKNGDELTWHQQFRDSKPLLLVNNQVQDLNDVKLDSYERQDVMNLQPHRQTLTSCRPKDLYGKRVVYDHKLFINPMKEIMNIEEMVHTSTGYMMLSMEHSIQELYYEENDVTKICIGDKSFSKHKSKIMDGLFGGGILYCVIRDVADVYFKVYKIDETTYVLSQSMIYYL